MPGINLQLLSRIYAQPWAMPQTQLALLPQLVIAPDAKPRASQAMDALKDRERRMTAAERQKASRTVWTWDGPIEVFAQAGYEPLSYEAWIAAEAEMLPPVPSNVTVLLVWGVLGRGWTASDRYWLDAIDVDDLAAAIERTPEGSTVVLWFRSPGGIITGIPETAAFLRAAGKKRRLLVWTDDLCASAAYWLASQAEAIYATPTADVGSIGVYIAFYDFTEYLKKNGVSLELFKAGSMKAMGLPGNPLSEEEGAYLQASVDEGYRQFTADVLRNRDIAADTMQGQTHRGQNVVERNLADKFFPSSAAFFSAMGKGKV